MSVALMLRLLDYERTNYFTCCNLIREYFRGDLSLLYLILFSSCEAHKNTERPLIVASLGCFLIPRVQTAVTEQLLGYHGDTWWSFVRGSTYMPPGTTFGSLFEKA